MNAQDISFKSSLLNYVNGRNNADADVGKVYEKILRDPLLRSFIAELDIARLRRSPPPTTITPLLWQSLETDKEQELSLLPFDIVAPPSDIALAGAKEPAAPVSETPAETKTVRGKVLDKTI